MSADPPNKPKYGKEWPKCAVCGLMAQDVEGTPPRCKDPDRCSRVIKGEPLGGTPMNITKLEDIFPDPPMPEHHNGVE